MNRVLRSAATVAAVLLASCGGGAGGGGAAIPPSTPQPTFGPTAPIQIAIVIPTQLPSAKGRSPQFVSPVTTTVSISVNAGAAQTFAVSGAPACNQGTTTVSGSCTVYSVNAPVGNDTFVVSLYDAQNRLLSQGSAQATIVLNTTNIVNITFDGIVGAVRVSLSSFSPPAGTPAKIEVFPLPVDVDGYTLVGSPGTLPSMTVSDSDTSGATGLYLAGSDGTCNTQASAPAASVAISQTGTRYPRVCLNYTGALVGTVTITAAIAGGPSGSAPFVPSQGQTTVSGVWLSGEDPTAHVPVLQRVDPSLHAVVAISGSQTHLGVSQAIAVDSTGNVDALNESQNPQNIKAIDTYSGTNGGNVPPLVTTDIPPIPGQYIDSDSLGLDTNTIAYVVAYRTPPSSTAPLCTIYRVALTGGTVTPTVAGDCSFAGSGVGKYLRVDAQRRVYLSYYFSTTAPAQVYRFARNADGTLSAEAAITMPKNAYGMDVTLDGDVYVSDITQQIARYSSSAFVPGSKTSPAPADTYSVPARGLAIDLQGNLYFADTTSQGYPPSSVVKEIPAGSHTPVNSLPFITGGFARATTTAPANGSALTAQPSSVQLPGQNSVTLTESGYSGPITQTNNCAGIATVAPASTTGPSATFSITQGHSGGTCSIVFGDAGPVHTTTVNIGNTQVIVTGQAVRRRT